MKPEKTVDSSVQSIARTWWRQFSLAVANRRFADLDELLLPDCYWRDLLAFGWIIRTSHGPKQIIEWIGSSEHRLLETDLGEAERAEPGVLGKVASSTIDFFSTFRTSVGAARCHVRLVVEDGAARAITILTALREIEGYPERVGKNRPRNYRLNSGNEAVDTRIATDPEVVVVGAGHSGLIMAARLMRQDISTLVVDSNAQIGDNWKQRYASLKLHNELCMNHFPYMSFPETWPAYIPRDLLVEWLDVYARCMAINVSMATTLVSARYDEDAGRWEVLLQSADGSQRTVRPAHIVLATGVSGIPNMPKIEGMEDFSGRVLHSSGMNDDIDVTNARVVVLGAGTSAHDIAQMCHLKGADVTLVQRSSITVASLEPSASMAYQLYMNNEGVRPLEDTDLIYASVPFDLLARLQVDMSHRMAEADKELLDGLKRVGFLLDNGEDDTGFLLKLHRYQAGYYFNVGASDLIVSGDIKLKAGTTISKVDRSTVHFDNGDTTEADVVVLATGYRPLKDKVASLFGSEVAERVGPIYGISNEGEVPGMYGLTNQPGFYVTGGGFVGARVYSRYIALTIKAQQLGLLKRPA